MRVCKPANLHKHWRRRWDSNPRDVSVKRISSAPRYDRFDTSPNINFLYVKPSNLTKRKIKAKFRAKQSEIAEIQNLKNLENTRLSGHKSSLRCITFRVRAVMTTSIPVQAKNKCIPNNPPPYHSKGKQLQASK